MRFLLWLILTAIPIVGLTQMPNDADVAQESYELAERYRLEVISSWEPTPNTATTTVAPVEDVPTERLIGATVVEPPPTATTEVSAQFTVRCGEWWAAAVTAGWPTERIPTLLDSIVWAESRCLPDVDNGADFGLTQINWHTWRELVESTGLKRDHLFDPVLNLRVALLISQAAEAAGWRWCQPWDSSGRHC